MTAAPRETPTVELETTFDDDSLEMNGAGDKFRVAQALQDELAADTARVATMRFPFTLRAAAVGDYEEIGWLRLDPTPFGAALRLVAELEISAAGYAAELELWNLTDAELVATLSTGSLVTEKRTADVTLPLKESLYSVRLRCVGAEETERASCRSAFLEVNNG